MCRLRLRSVKHFLTNLRNVGNPVPPHRYDDIRKESPASTSSNSSINNCVFAAEFTARFGDVFAGGKRKNILRVPHSQVPTPKI